jgi:hypothetical protein
MTTTPEVFARLEDTCRAGGPAAMLDELAATLAAAGRWHALFDARLLAARLALGLPPAGDLGTVPPDVRERLDERTVAAAWMYLRAAAEPEKLAARLEALAAREPPADADDEESARRLQEIVGLALWEGVDPALGIALVLRTQGTCNAITAYEQAVSRLPAARQRPAARVLVEHLHRELCGSLAADLEARGIADVPPDPTTLPDLLAAAGGLADDPSVHVDVSHLQSVLRIARVCDDEPTVRRAWELAVYGCRLPAEVVYPGEPPFAEVAPASRLFFGALVGRDIEEAVRFFRHAAATAETDAGTLPCDTLVLLLWRLGRPAEALHAALGRPADRGMPSTLEAAGLLPSLVDLATAAGDWATLRRACIDRGDAITFAATLAVEASVKRS